MKNRICKALKPFWYKVSVSRIPLTKLWRIEISKRFGLNHKDNKNCAYAILDTLCGDFSLTCVVSVKGKYDTSSYN